MVQEEEEAWKHSAYNDIRIPVIEMHQNNDERIIHLLVTARFVT